MAVTRTKERRHRQVNTI